MTTKHRASCHCGQIQIDFEAQAPFTVYECNCSICQMVGYLHLILPREDVQITAGKALLTSYRFNTGVANHLFCPRCGVKPVYVPRSHPHGLSINGRCIEGVTLEELNIEPFDGANWEANVASIQDQG